MKNTICTSLLLLVFVLNQAFCPPSVLNEELVLVESGTRVKATVLRTISTEDTDAQVSNLVQMQVDEDVVVAGQIVITKGSPAEGMIVSIKRKNQVKNYPDKLLRIEVALKSAKAVDGQTVHISGKTFMSKSLTPKCAAEITTTMRLEGCVESSIWIRKR
jgi:hypothetical protein